MSFFDDDEPTRVSSGSRTARRRRAAPDARPATSGGTPPDHQTARTRQLVAVGVAIVIVLVLGLAIKGCADSRKERALKDYNRDVSTIISASNEEVAQPFFELLSSGDVNKNDLGVQVNQLRLNAADGAKRARELDVPGDMQEAHQNVVLTLNLRAGALEQIAAKLDAAQGRGQQAEKATEQIAGQMKAFLASDVVWSQRAAPLIVEALDDAGIGGQTVEKSEFLPGYTWLAPQTVAAAIGGQASGSSSTVAPGLHGHGIIGHEDRRQDAGAGAGLDDDPREGPCDGHRDLPEPGRQRRARRRGGDPPHGAGREGRDRQEDGQRRRSRRSRARSRSRSRRSRRPAPRPS